MAAVPRRTTIHDLAALRVHPDGTRVLPPTATSTKPRKAHRAVKDVRGNWIASDAGGTEGVKRSKRKVTDRDTGEGEVFELPGAEQDSEGEGVGTTERKKGKKRDIGLNFSPKDARTRKRKRFEHDLGFLEPTPLPSVNTIPAHLVASLPTPSSDLLKCIHHFASDYYTEHGQLYNATREARSEKKRKRARKLAAQAPGSISPAKRVVDMELAEDDASLGGEDDCPSTPHLKLKHKGDPSTLGRDMYRSMDGSALMAIGMLLQEYIADLVVPRIPDGWEEEMLNAQRGNAEDQEEKIDGEGSGIREDVTSDDEVEDG